MRRDRLGFLTIRVDNPTLFSVQPALAPDGTLTYTPAPDANGSTGVAVWLRDDGGTLNGGRDTSPPYSFVIAVNPLNDRPSFGAGPDQTVLRTSGTTVYSVDGWATGVSSGPANETGQTLEFQVINDNAALFTPDGQPAIDASGRLTYTPASDAIGTALLTVRLRDSGGTGGGGQDVSAERTFTITVAEAYIEAGVAYVGGDLRQPARGQ